MELSLELVHDFISDIYDASMDDTLWPEIVSKLAQLVRAEESLMFSPRLTKDSSFSFLSPHQHIDPTLWNLYDAYFWQHDVWAIECFKQGLIYNGSVVHGDQLLPRRQLRKTEIFSEMYKPHMMGIEVVMGACIIDRSGGDVSRPVFLNFFRTFSAQSFSDNEERFIRLLLPHIERSLSIRQKLYEGQQQSSWTMNILEKLTIGILLVSIEGQVIFINSNAEAILRQSTQINVSLGRLGCRNSRQNDSIRNALKHASVGIGSSIQLNDESALSRYSFTFSPLTQGILSSPFAKAKVMITVTKVQIGEKANIGAFSSKYRLTPAETRVFLYLLKDLSTTEIAQELGVSTNTLRSQLKAIFSKTSAKNQRDLLRIFFS